MANDLRQSSGMAGVVAIGAVVIALYSIDWAQVALDLFWFLVDWVLNSGQRLVDAVLAVLRFIFR